MSRVALLRRPRRAVAAVVTASSVLVAGTAVTAGAQQTPVPACVGVIIDATVDAASVPGGSWSVQDACVPLDAVYEAEVLGYHLVGGLGVATYTDGHVGRVAFVTAQVAPDRSLALVGVEDQATGTVTWAYVDGPYAEVGTTRTFGGAANAATIVAGQEPGPVESGRVDLGIEGVGTDLATAQGPVPDRIRTLLDQAVAAFTA